LKIRMIAVAALGLASACGGGSAPSEGPGPESGAEGGPAGELAQMGNFSIGGGEPRVFSLLGARERLALTSHQVTVLDSVNRVWASRNDSLQRSLRAVWGNSRSRSNASFQQARPVLIAIAENNDVANSAVESLLDAGQRSTACTIQMEQRGEARAQSAAQGRGGRPGGRAGGRPPPRRPRGGAPLDTVPGTRALRGWPWCAATPADSARRR
jgi:hypothetical protein